MDRVGVLVKITESKFFFLSSSFLYYYDLHICRIVRCVLDGTGIDGLGTCAAIETAIRCVNSINENCAASAIFVGAFTLDYNAREVYSDEPCFHQRFDEYFNQDGLCSFEDVKK